MNLFPNLIVKFHDHAFSDSIQHGNLYLSRLTSYHNNEDPSEGTLPVRNSHVFIPDSNVSISLHDAKIKTKIADYFAFCVLGVSLEDGIPFKFSDKQKFDLRRFGDNALVIRDCAAFFDRVERGAMAAGITEICGRFVSYYDDTENSADRFIDAIFDIQNVGFQKDKGHDCAHEFPLLFQIPQCKEEHSTLNIGDIHDISEIYKTSDILNAYILN